MTETNINTKQKDCQGLGKDIRNVPLKASLGLWCRKYLNAQNRGKKEVGKRAGQCDCFGEHWLMLTAAVGHSKEQGNGADIHCEEMCLCLGSLEGIVGNPSVCVSFTER